MPAGEVSREEYDMRSFRAGQDKVLTELRTLLRGEFEIVQNNSDILNAALPYEQNDAQRAVAHQIETARNDGRIEELQTFSRFVQERATTDS